jgi:amino acid transporter
MGYAQELARRMHAFQNFAISFSIICIVSGGINSFNLGFSAAGGASVGIGWAVCCFFSLMVALAMAQIGSAYPTAGGLYHWGSILGGKGLGWLTAWFNLIGLITVLAAINVGTYLFMVGSLAPVLGLDTSALLPAEPTTYSLTVQVIAVSAITFSQALVNHLGIKLTTKLTDASGYIILGVAVALTLTMLVVAPSLDLSRLWTFTNYSGAAGGDAWPETGSLFYLFLLGLLLPAYTITGMDASAHTAEETVNAARTIPKGMIHAVLWSGVFGWLMLSSVVLAIPNMDEAAAQPGNEFFWIMDQVVPVSVKLALYLFIFIAQYLCGLATVTSASRMVYAFARDGGLPWSGLLRQVSATYRTPVPAIWISAVLAVLFTVYTPVYSTITAVCVIFLYISYVLPVAAGLVAHGRTWTHMGPFDMGFWFKPVAVVSILFCALLFFIGVQPPNDKALTVTIAFFVLTAAVWYGFERRRFQGPPTGELIKARQAEIMEAERAVGEAGGGAPIGGVQPAAGA